MAHVTHNVINDDPCEMSSQEWGYCTTAQQSNNTVNTSIQLHPTRLFVTCQELPLRHPLIPVCVRVCVCVYSSKLHCTQQRTAAPRL